VPKCQRCGCWRCSDELDCNRGGWLLIKLLNGWLVIGDDVSWVDGGRCLRGCLGSIDSGGWKQWEHSNHLHDNLYSFSFDGGWCDNGGDGGWIPYESLTPVESETTVQTTDNVLRPLESGIKSNKTPNLVSIEIFDFITVALSDIAIINSYSINLYCQMSSF